MFTVEVYPGYQEGPLEKRTQSWSDWRSAVRYAFLLSREGDVIIKDREGTLAHVDLRSDAPGFDRSEIGFEEGIDENHRRVNVIYGK